MIEGSYKRSEGVLSNPVQNRAVLYSQDQGRAIVLNPTGAALWEVLESPRSAAELTSFLMDRFPDLNADRARADVDAFLDRLLAENVLQSLS